MMLDSKPKNFNTKFKKEFGLIHLFLLFYFLVPLFKKATQSISKKVFMSGFNFDYKAILLSFFVISFMGISSFAQDAAIDSSLFKNQVDIKDVLHKLKKKDKPIKKKDDKAFQFALIVAGGYTSNTGFAVSGGANGAFTIKGATKESSALMSFTYTQFNQTILPFSVSVWTKNDRLNFVIDDRYINYPSALYGLRGRSKLDSGYTVNFSWLKLHQSVLVKIHKNFYAGVGLYYDYFWGIKEVGVPAVTPTVNNPKGLGSAFEFFTGQKLPDDEETAFGPAFKLLFDSRDNPINAKKGFYAAAMFHPSFQSWGSDANWSTLVLDARKYVSLSQNKNNVLAFWGYLWSSFGNQPFLLLPSTGWDEFWNTGRGFSQGRYRGADMRYLEAEYRFQVSKNGLLGGVLFSNLQNFPDELFTSYSEYRGRKTANVTSVGYGLGLRLKLNKYSKTNLAVDMGFGQDFPKPWIAVNLGEVF